MVVIRVFKLGKYEIGDDYATLTNTFGTWRLADTKERADVWREWVLRQRGGYNPSK